MNSLDVGYVYLLVNPEIPGYVKIGKTHRDPAIRAKELSTSGVPGYWKVHHQRLVPQCDVVEQAVHRSLSQNRPIRGRELFKVDPEEGVRAIESLSKSNIAYFPHWPNLRDFDRSASGDLITAQLLDEENTRQRNDRNAEAAAKRQQESQRARVDVETRRILKSGVIGVAPFFWVALIAMMYRDGKEVLIVGASLLCLLVGFFSRLSEKKAARQRREEVGLTEIDS
ncbi:GIY-YIG nuclease family protein [Microbulbifer elongatus]|uniref:GIY-YIG nuclease family protein n=1 Tax=Microbulbifer elongatus TaxID=86173 RepID=UPI001CFEFF48|nr:GIY-YIG nuclease family protein [Microbulbifer elongatus]